MDELNRFAQRLVEQLAASRDGVHRAVEVAELRQTVLPYRTHRRALGIDSVEDYETVLLRLVSGERGYVKTLPAEAAERCRKELSESNPDLAVLDEVAAATVQITSMAAAGIVDGGADGRSGGQAVEADGRTGGRAVEADGRTGGRAVEEEKATPPAKSEKPARKAAPSAGPPDRPSAVEPAKSASSASPAVPVACPSCHRSAPAGRQVVFCPWCGKRLIPFTCARCNTELDSAWKHCITCGAPVKDPYSYS